MTDKQRNKYYQSKYGISLKQYNAMLNKQHFSCAICKKHQTEFKRRLSVDHNHRTGKVRALVCFYCNKFKVGRNSMKTAKEIYDYFRKYDRGEK